MWEGNRCGVGEEEKVVMEEGGLGDSLLGTRKDGKHSLDRREDVWRVGGTIWDFVELTQSCVLCAEPALFRQNLLPPSLVVVRNQRKGPIYPPR